ncbi:MAG: ATP-binding cassette domain-containing protein [Oscillatoriales cyanobacterium SM2_2_1]|nr:ATP-binding cassette domain-containing protein [Oscillatoriales cyanobacterium SM2_2_1]
MSLLRCQNLAVATLLPPLTLELSAGSRALLQRPGDAITRLFFRLLNRLREPTSGQIFWHGQELSTYSVTALRQQILLVPEAPYFFGMTVAETIAYPLNLRRLSRSQIRPVISLWMERMELPRHWSEQKEFELTLGDRQWVALTRALVAAPQLFLLENPLAPLTPSRQQHILQILATQSSAAVVMVHPDALPLPWQPLSALPTIPTHHTQPAEEEWGALSDYDCERIDPPLGRSPQQPAPDRRDC